MAPRIDDSTTPVPGFRFAAASAAIKSEGRLDIGLAVADAPTTVAGLFTSNVVRAAPVVLSAQRIANGRAQAILANSGCANACTGQVGHLAARATTGAVADALRIDAADVLPASTGVIGARLPVERMIAQTTALVGGLSRDGADRFSQAILTTDRGPKVVHVRGEMGGRPFVVMGIAKGAGMIHPAVIPLVPHATMLAFLFTDAVADAASLAGALIRVSDATFNRASVDGDTSTNDTVLAFASGLAGTTGSDTVRVPIALEEAMGLVCERLARAMVADGEGAEHLAEIVVRGTNDDVQALIIARTIATSPLVKTALYGQDPNWGRILGAAGRAGVTFDPDAVSIAIGGVAIVARGMAIGAEREAEARRRTASMSS